MFACRRQFGHSLFGGKRQDPAHLIETALRQVSSQYLERTKMFFNKNRVPSAATEGFDTECPGAGKQIQHQAVIHLRCPGY